MKLWNSAVDVNGGPVDVDSGPVDVDAGPVDTGAVGTGEQQTSGLVCSDWAVSALASRTVSLETGALMRLLGSALGRFLGFALPPFEPKQLRDTWLLWSLVWP